MTAAFNECCLVLFEFYSRLKFLEWIYRVYLRSGEHRLEILVWLMICIIFWCYTNILVNRLSLVGCKSATSFLLRL